MVSRAGRAHGRRGYAAGPGGNGTGTAVIAAYLRFAGELAAAYGDYRVAFTPLSDCYDPTSRGARSRPGAAPACSAPATAKKISQRDRFFRILPTCQQAKGFIRYMSTRTATAIRLPDYA